MPFDPTERNVDPFLFPARDPYDEETCPDIGHP